MQTKAFVFEIAKANKNLANAIYFYQRYGWLVIKSLVLNYHAGFASGGEYIQSAKSF